jgi:hypothetical protein
MFRKSYVNRQEDHFVHAALYGVFHAGSSRLKDALEYILQRATTCINAMKNIPYRAACTM